MNSPACSRDRVTTMRLPNSGRSSNQRRCWRSPATAPMTKSRRLVGPRPRRDRAERSFHGVLRGDGGVVDQRRRLLFRPAVRDQRPRDRADLRRAGVADDGAAEPRQRRPLDVGLGVGLRLVPAHERQHVTALGIGDRNAGVGRAADGRGNAGHDLERDALLVEEQRFLAAAVEHEGVPPLQADHGLALARLLGEEDRDRFLVERLRRRGADVDHLGLAPRPPQQPGVDAVVVDDDVGHLEVALPADADQRRVAWAGAHDVDKRTVHSAVRSPLSALRAPLSALRGPTNF